MRGFAILVGFQLAGIMLHRAGAPIPAAVLGLMLFTACLGAGLVKVEWVEKSSSILLRNMLLFFVPVIVGITKLIPLLAHQWIPIAGSLLVSLIAAMLTTAFVSDRLLREAAIDDERK